MHIKTHLLLLLPAGQLQGMLFHCLCLTLYKLLLLLCTACIAYYRGIETGSADPGTAGPKFPVATSTEPTINNKHEMQD